MLLYSLLNLISGGAKDLSVLPFDVMSGPPESFSGCIRNLHVNNILLPLEQQNIQGEQVSFSELIDSLLTLAEYFDCLTKIKY